MYSEPGQLHSVSRGFQDVPPPVPLPPGKPGCCDNGGPYWDQQIGPMQVRVVGCQVSGCQVSKYFLSPQAPRSTTPPVSMISENSDILVPLVLYPLIPLSCQLPG